ncbi:uncharacterized protein LOC126685692 [Mercurialis annua]|uniref:uncharacterized protein LOC126685692 n=1 Tax=Mercurialis annua TaxID=3986 RepID=UPI00216008AC|nr:uncharacterized protein LOC126685692 [Mercurialis annua]
MSSARRRNPSTIQIVQKYEDIYCEVWYGQKRPFENTPIRPCMEKTQARHIFVGRHSKNLADFGNAVVSPEPEWGRLWEVRCEMEAYCDFHCIPVPRAMSATIARNTESSVQFLMERLEIETHVMGLRLRAIHQDTPDWCDMFVDIRNPTSWNTMELQDYDQDDSDDFVKYLPWTLSRCCAQCFNYVI